MRRVKIFGIVFAVSIVAVGCGGGGSDGSGGSSSGGETIQIGAVHPVTGPLAVDGKQMRSAVQMAVEDVNEDGGIEALDGAQLEVVAADSAGEPETAQQETQRMIDDGAAAIVGPYTSSSAATVARTAERSQVPFVIDVAAAKSILEQGYKYTFRVQPDSEDMGQAGARYLAQISEATGSPVETVAYIHENSEYGTSVSAAFTEAAQGEGIEVAADISYDAANVSDLTSQVTEAAAADPDVIVATNYYADGLLLASAAADVQPDVKGIYGVANGAFDLDQFPEDAGQDGESYLSSNYHFDATSDRVKELRDSFQQENDSRMRTPAVFSYQAVEVIADALERAESSDPADLREALTQTSLETELFPFDGPIKFNEKGQNVNAQPIVMQVQDGEVVQVFPDEFAQAEPQFPDTPWGMQ